MKGSTNSHKIVFIHH